MGWLDNIKIGVETPVQPSGSVSTAQPSDGVNTDVKEENGRVKTRQIAREGLARGANWHENRMEAQRKRNEDEDKRRQSELKTYYPNLF